MMPTSLLAVYFRGVTVSLAAHMADFVQRHACRWAAKWQTVHDQNRLPTGYSV